LGAAPLQTDRRSSGLQRELGGNFEQPALSLPTSSWCGQLWPSTADLSRRAGRAADSRIVRHGGSHADYLPLDLSAHLDAAIDVIPDGARAPRGRVMLRGLPFQIGAADPEAAGPRLIARGGSHGDDDLTIPIGQTAKRVIVCHVLLHSDIWEGGSVGEPVAEYTFRIAGRDYREPIRERFEIAIARPPWGQWPFRCFADHGDGMSAREQGSFGQSGFRLTEVTYGNPAYYYLWVWTPPDHDAVLESLTVRPAGPAFASRDHPRQLTRIPSRGTPRCP